MQIDKIKPISGRELHGRRRTDRCLHMVGEEDLRRDDDLGLALPGRPGLVVLVSLQIEDKHARQNHELRLSPGPVAATLVTVPVEHLCREVELQQILHRHFPGPKRK